ncbi:MAG: hypothetical protein LPH21_12395 [Shewanella sp.]|nr:hypothetical protein [Shewanella sp.]
MSDVSKYVLKGQNGFLFLNNDSNGVIDQHTGQRLLSSDELQQWLTTYSERKAFCQRAGIDFYVQLSPDKHRIYREYLPPEIKRAEFTTGDQFSAIVRSVLGPYFLDASDVLLPAKNTGELFHRTDTHWNARGAYLAYQQFIEAAGKKRKLGKPAVFKAREMTLPGDLGCKFSPMIKSTFIQSDLERDRWLSFSNEIVNTGCIKIFRNNQPDLPKCMVYGSSSLYEYYLDYLAESFGTVMFVWDLAFDYDLIAKFKPDVIFNQVRERFVVRPVKDQQDFSAIDRTIIKKYLLGEGGGDLSLLADVLELDELRVSAAKLLSGVYEKVMTTDFSDKKYIRMLAVALKNTGQEKAAKQLCHKKGVILGSAEKEIDEELKKAWTERHIQMIKQSEFFDASYYLDRYKDIARSGIDPARHYFNQGWKENRNPSLLFSTRSYLSEYDDVKVSGMNPLLHYLTFGRKEGRHIVAVESVC